MAYRRDDLFDLSIDDVIIAPCGPIPTSARFKLLSSGSSATASISCLNSDKCLSGSQDEPTIGFLETSRELTAALTFADLINSDISITSTRPRSCPERSQLSAPFRQTRVDFGPITMVSIPVLMTACPMAVAPSLPILFFEISKRLIAAISLFDISGNFIFGSKDKHQYDKTQVHRDQTGLAAICEALSECSALKSINLSDIGMGPQGAVMTSSMLRS
eukprot:SAG11_NODE_12270_length_711_cov_3.717320_1_plen_217_part_10